MRRRTKIKLALVPLSLVLALTMAELSLRWVGPRLLTFYGQRDLLNYLYPGSDVAGPHSHPCWMWQQPKPRGDARQRLLFIGDSVTLRQHIVDALRDLFGNSGHQYLVAAQEGYNARQVVALYRGCRRARADQVIFTLHNNDFQQARVMLQPLFGAAHPLDLEQKSFAARWLVFHSYLYRLWLGQPGVFVGRDPLSTSQWKRARAQVGAALKELRDSVRQDGGRLTVLVLPSLNPKPPSPAARESHRSALLLLRELKIRHFDLQPPFARAARSGIRLHQTEGDLLHPSRELARRFARYLKDQGLL